MNVINKCEEQDLHVSNQSLREYQQNVVLNVKIK